MDGRVEARRLEDEMKKTKTSGGGAKGRVGRVPTQDQDEVIRLLAELLAGTQVPRSLGYLGMATHAWDQLRAKLNLFGWMTAEEVQMRLRAGLGLPATDAAAAGAASNPDSSAGGAHE